MLRLNPVKLARHLSGNYPFRLLPTQSFPRSPAHDVVLVLYLYTRLAFCLINTNSSFEFNLFSSKHCHEADLQKSGCRFGLLINKPDKQSVVDDMRKKSQKGTSAN